MNILCTKTVLKEDSTLVKDDADDNKQFDTKLAVTNCPFWHSQKKIINNSLLRFVSVSNNKRKCQ